ncbi:MAG: YicC family protein [Deltaproteobacteria bacterium]|nr:YicC family protein [Deltaproteobacteria bacterium]
MIQSMTGYGRGSTTSGDVEVTAEVKSLNHRYLEMNVRLSSSLSFLEPPIRDRIRKFVNRGKIDATVTVKDRRERARKLAINESLLHGYMGIEKKLRDTFGLSGSLSLDKVISLNGIVSVEEVEPDDGPVARMVLKATEEAMRGVSQMRKAEGKAIGKYLKETARILRSLNRKITSLSKESKRVMGVKMQERIAEFISPEIASSEIFNDRLALEIAALADKLDISEEVARIKSHLDQFVSNLRIKTGSVGRKLDFILQELNREFNTIGSKSQSDQITGIVIEAKAHLEKMREQVQNVE